MIDQLLANALVYYINKITYSSLLYTIT